MDYNRENDVDLFRKYMPQIIRSQILNFNVSEKQIHIDSRIIGGNIAWHTHYKNEYETLESFIKEQTEHIYKHSLSEGKFLLIAHTEEKGNKFTYCSNEKGLYSPFCCFRQTNIPFRQAGK